MKYHARFGTLELWNRNRERALSFGCAGGLRGSPCWRCRSVCISGALASGPITMMRRSTPTRPTIWPPTGSIATIPPTTGPCSTTSSPAPLSVRSEIPISPRGCRWPSQVCCSSPLRSACAVPSAGEPPGGPVSSRRCRQSPCTTADFSGWMSWRWSSPRRPGSRHGERHEGVMRRGHGSGSLSVWRSRPRRTPMSPAPWWSGCGRCWPR